MSAADIAAHEAASYVRRPRKVLATSPAGHPRGSRPAEELARQFRDHGVPATVVQDIRTDRFLIVEEAGS
ncbi:hypothetical protein F7R91_14575 [Streptomyces luteolifulvus]|uniref:Uncharacterized protein n=2 Tax=Streptomyces luteolifulvus TaxID=2615112 RepID=A0A6H9V069_9ACTN|nr:hypothetical protein [Streptomyces luteolifulvus]KAB1146911.1 hypothetical protein F7R91_14575 [Streptomyces luteolifulvus]